MNVLTNRKGFSLVELLTVIAIIAILASIIFPVMSMVGNKARMNKCMTQLHQIGLAVQIFKQDNRKYPDILGIELVLGGDGNVVPMDQSAPSPNQRAVGLFPEYVISARLYHCPNSKHIDPTQIVAASPVYDPLNDGVGINAYAYNSYDFMIYGTDIVVQHYKKRWAGSPDDVNNAAPGEQPDAQRDYERQLVFKTPPDNTVITWCSWHEIYSLESGSNVANITFKGKAPTLFLDGHVDALDGHRVETHKWRVLPKTE